MPNTTHQAFFDADLDSKVIDIDGILLDCLVSEIPKHLPGGFETKKDINGKDVLVALYPMNNSHSISINTSNSRYMGSEFNYIDEKVTKVS